MVEDSSEVPGVVCAVVVLVLVVVEVGYFAVVVVQSGPHEDRGALMFSHQRVWCLGFESGAESDLAEVAERPPRVCCARARAVCLAAPQARAAFPRDVDWLDAWTPFVTSSSSSKGASQWTEPAAKGKRIKCYLKIKIK